MIPPVRYVGANGDEDTSGGNGDASAGDDLPSEPPSVSTPAQGEDEGQGRRAQQSGASLARRTTPAMMA
jgi:hypothetical protein